MKASRNTTSGRLCYDDNHLDNLRPITQIYANIIGCSYFEQRAISKTHLLLRNNMLIRGIIPVLSSLFKKECELSKFLFCILKDVPCAIYI